VDNKAVKIAVLDSVPKSYWDDDLGITDAQKFVDLLSPENPQAILDSYYVSEYEFPNSLDAYDAYVITGSPLSVYDDFDWMSQLSQLILDANHLNKRIVASCFGHQLVAKIFGGEVGNNEEGWAIGNYALNITQQYDWMRPSAPNTGLYHFNKERVTILPENAQSFANTASYPHYAFTLGDNILSFQGHPEQPKRAMKNFLAATLDKLSEEERVKAAIFIDNDETDAGIWAQWMMRFMVS
jgi:GMP synthase-like glutamine amidotransferase